MDASGAMTLLASQSPWPVTPKRLMTTGAVPAAGAWAARQSPPLAATVRARGRRVQRRSARRTRGAAAAPRPGQARLGQAPSTMSSSSVRHQPGGGRRSAPREGAAGGRRPSAARRAFGAGAGADLGRSREAGRVDRDHVTALPILAGTLPTDQQARLDRTRGGRARSRLPFARRRRRPTPGRRPSVAGRARCRPPRRTA
jgi:hypothetical protein